MLAKEAPVAHHLQGRSGGIGLEHRIPQSATATGSPQHLTKFFGSSVGAVQVAALQELARSEGRTRHPHPSN